MNAYNYENQAWVTGDEAKAVRRSQIESELALLTGESSQEYLRFCGIPTAQAQASIEKLKTELSTLN